MLLYVLYGEVPTLWNIKICWKPNYDVSPWEMRLNMVEPLLPKHCEAVLFFIAVSHTSSLGAAIVKQGTNWTNWLRAAHWELKNGSSRETDDRILEYTRICLMRNIHMNKVWPRICEEHNLSAWLWNWQASAWIRNSTCAGHGTAQIMLRFSGCQVRNANPLVTGHTWSTLSSPPCQLPALPQRSWHGDPVMLRCLHGIHWIPLTICQECQGWGSSCCKPFVLFNDPHSSLLFYSTHPLYTVLLQGCLQMRYLESYLYGHTAIWCNGVETFGNGNSCSSIGSGSIPDIWRFDLSCNAMPFHAKLFCALCSVIYTYMIICDGVCVCACTAERCLGTYRYDIYIYIHTIHMCMGSYVLKAIRNKIRLI